MLGQVAAGRQEEEEDIVSSKDVEREDHGGSASRGGASTAGRQPGLSSSSSRIRGGATSGSRQERPKKVSPPPIGSQRTSVQRPLPQNRSGPHHPAGTMRNPPPSHKTLQVGDKKVESTVRKKSVEKRLGVKESQKKPSAVDKDRGSGGGLADKKDSRRLGLGVTTERPRTTTTRGEAQERRQSKATDRSPALTKTEPNKEKNDNNDKSPIAPAAKKADKKLTASEEKNGPGGKSCPKPMVKHSSSVSLVRKKFERKMESGEREEKKHVTQPVPKGAISQNLFLKGDANAKKKAETTSLAGVEDPTKRQEDGVEQDQTEEEKVVVEVEEEEKSVVCRGGPSDTETVPSQHSLVADEWGDGCVSSWAGSPEPVAHLSRRQTIPNLNIDDVSPHHHHSGEEEEEQEVLGNNRLNLDVRLEHELPESPAYRSPLLSDSEGEGDEPPHSSRQHVLEAYVAGTEEPSLRNKLLSNLVNKRSESDGIVTLDRPRPEPAIR